jgi:hypothetical protein
MSPLSSFTEPYGSRLFIPKLLLPFFNGRVECWKALSPRSLLRSCGSLHGKPAVDACSEGSRFHNDPVQIENLIIGWIDADLEATEDVRADAPPLSDKERDGQTDNLGTNSTPKRSRSFRSPMLS